jgi:predicted DNA binding CopG/RHH family protein
LPPALPILRVEKIHEGTTKRGGDDDASHSREPTPAATFGPVPSPKTALHASNQGLYRLSSLGYSTSNLESGLTILSPKRLNPPAAILAVLRIQEVNSRSTQGGADCDSIHLNTPPYRFGHAFPSLARNPRRHANSLDSIPELKLGEDAGSCASGGPESGQEVLPMSAATKWTDPFDDMSDEEFDEHVESLFSERSRAVAVSLRVPADLLGRLKRQASRMGVPYQTLMKSVLESAVARLERHKPSQRRRAHRG